VNAGKKLAQARELTVFRPEVVPHWLMQWASSTAMKLTSHRDRSARNAVAAFADQALGRDIQQR
jgi:hypothetical protein